MLDVQSIAREKVKNFFARSFVLNKKTISIQDNNINSPLIINVVIFIMLEKLKKQPHLKQYITYSFAFIAYGLYLASLGPMLPFLAEKAKVSETQLSFLFNSRIYGSILTFIAMKYLQSREVPIPTHQILGITGILIIIFNLLFVWATSYFFQGLWMVLVTTNYLIFEILLDLSIIIYNQNVEKMLLLASGCFGIGSALSPIIIGIAGVQTSFLVYSLILGLILPAFFFLSSPKMGQESPQNPEQVEKTISRPVEILLGGAYCIYLGIMITKVGWSSSYAVMNGVSTKEQATIFPFLYSITSIIFKFVWLFVPYATSTKFRFCMPALVAIQTLSMIAAKLDFVSASLYFNNISLGIFMSPLNTLIFSVNKVYNLKMTDRQASNITMAGVFGEIILVMICGELMKRVHIDMYYHFVVFMTGVLWIFGSYAMHLMAKEIGQKPSLEFQLLERTSCRDISQK